MSEKDQANERRGCSLAVGDVVALTTSGRFYHLKLIKGTGYSPDSSKSDEADGYCFDATGILPVPRNFFTEDGKAIFAALSNLIAWFHKLRVWELNESEREQVERCMGRIGFGTAQFQAGALVVI